MYSTRHVYDDQFIQDELTTPSPDEFNAWLAIEPDVTTVNDRSANIFWRGESDASKGYAQTRKQENFRDCWNIGMDREQLVFVKDDRYGNRIIRFWLTRDHNITARIRYCKNDPHYLVEFFSNHRSTNAGNEGRWAGNLVAKFQVHRTVTDEAELTVSKYVALEFAKAQANA